MFDNDFQRRVLADLGSCDDLLEDVRAYGLRQYGVDLTELDGHDKLLLVLAAQKAREN